MEMQVHLVQPVQEEKELKLDKENKKVTALGVSSPLFCYHDELYCQMQQYFLIHLMCRQTPNSALNTVKYITNVNIVVPRVNIILTEPCSAGQLFDQSRGCSNCPPDQWSSERNTVATCTDCPSGKGVDAGQGKQESDCIWSERFHKSILSLQGFTPSTFTLNMDTHVLQNFIQYKHILLMK